MSNQVRYGITWGSGQSGIEFEKLLQQAAQIEGKAFSVWIKETLRARANELVKKPVKQEAAIK